MHFATSALALVASAAAASAASVTFWTLDDATRTVYFTPSDGSSQLDSVTVSNAEKKVVQFPDNWIGNFYAIQDGKNNVPGMLGEVNFNAWNGLTYFDVSAIVDPKDHDNVKQMWPAKGESPMSGCEVFPCNNCYWLPDDVQTKATKEVDLITTLGSGSTGMNFAEAQ
ncbi:DNase1 protein [Pochonia chlamydosporia 170]|uniref:DNase1 protein n=1 Tax=Pochonia chlamydosporia 170 TaxID=1380566 RepID=A0A179FGJ9_METCM|nr:DNase1 protein [Pochonia chlamydosporia 170]OAQ64652.1 DNase1 protein [Pochonia chlamydosporia 170]